MNIEIHKPELEASPAATARDPRKGNDPVVALQASPHRELEIEPPRFLDWSQCTDVESVPGKLSGAWVFRGTRMPVQTVFLNLEAGMSLREITEVYDVTPEEVKAVLHFASQSLIKEPTFAG